jgi:hypothetical protein
MIALAVRSILADTLVDLDAEPSEGLGDIFFGSRDEACGVGIFDTKKHVATVLASEKVVEQGGTNTTDVQSASRTRRKTNTNFCHF